MVNQGLRYYCDDSFKENDDSKWNFLLDYLLKNADLVAFNVLFTNKMHPSELNVISHDLLKKYEIKSKIYSSGESLIYNLTDTVKDFIKSKRYIDWKNYYLEDISFLKNNVEFFAAITHENYVILQMTEDLRKDFNENGFNFWWNWNIK